MRRARAAGRRPPARWSSRRPPARRAAARRARARRRAAGPAPGGRTASLGAQPARANPNPRRCSAVELLELMARAPGARTALDALGGEPGVYVVGGAVRDALLSRVPRELDVVVEGDAVPVARRAAERLGGDVGVHDRFGTATVRSPQATFDVVTAR